MEGLGTVGEVLEISHGEDRLCPSSMQLMDVLRLCPLSGSFESLNILYHNKFEILEMEKFVISEKDGRTFPCLPLL